MKAEQFTEALHYYVGLSNGSVGRKYSGGQRLQRAHSTVRSLLVAQAVPDDERITRFVGVLQVTGCDPNDPLATWQLVRGSTRKKQGDPDSLYIVEGTLRYPALQNDGVRVPFRRNTEIFCPYDQRRNATIGGVAVTKVLTSIPEIPVYPHA